MGYHDGSDGKKFICNIQIWVQSLGQEDPPGEGKGYLLQYSWLENPMDRDAL